MSDFFGTLVERLMPAVPAVSPRRAAQFELLAAELPAAPEPLAPIELPPVVMRPVSEKVSPPREPARPVMPASEVAAPSVLARPVATEAPTPRVRPDPVTPAPSAATSREVITTVVTVPAAPEPRRALPERLADAIAPRPKASREEEPPPPRREPAKERERDASATIARPMQKAPAIVPAVERAPAHAARAGTATRRDQPTVAASPPRIEVTIGTVEVRAQMAAPAPALPASAPREYAPPVSLNDYLRQRGARA